MRIRLLILLLLIFPNILTENILNIGYISRPGSSDPLFDDFKVQIDTLYPGKVNFTREELVDSGNDYSIILKKFSENNINNIFSDIDFKNWTKLDEELKAKDLLLWSIIPKPTNVCYDNIYAYLSLRKYFERRIFVFIFILNSNLIL